MPYACSEDDLQFAGLTCTDAEPCPIYLEIASVMQNGRKIFATGNLHSATGTLASILLSSGDNGQTWKEPFERKRGRALGQMQFYTLQNGWAAGETQYPLPRDPFFLLTTDAGESWREVPVGEEGMDGSIQRFWFDRLTHGEAVVDAGKGSGPDRFLTYESDTGGSSWSLRGKSGQSPRLKLAPSSLESDLVRARAAKDGKTWEVEQRNGDKWSPVASFLISVADCKFSDRELKEPEKDPAPADAPAPAPAKSAAGSAKKKGKK